MPAEEEIDFLEVDRPIPGQNYVCLSFISPEKIIENKLNSLTDKMLLDNIIGNLIIQKAYTKDEANKLYPGLDIKSDVILNSKNMLYFVSLNKGLINDKSNYGLFQFRLDSSEPKQLILK